MGSSWSHHGVSRKNRCGEWRYWVETVGGFALFTLIAYGFVLAIGFLGLLLGVEG